MKVAPLVGFPGRVLTKTTIKANLQDADTQFRTLLAITEKIQPDIVFTFMDLSVEAEAINLKVEFPEDDSPNVITHPVKNLSQFEEFMEIDFDKIFKSSRMKLFADVVKKYKQSCDVELSAYVIGPFSLAGLMADVTDLMLAIMCDCGFVLKLLDFTSRLILQYANRLADEGADYITILEPTAMMLSPEQFRYFVSPRINEICSYISVPSILHICGDTSHLFEEFRRIDSIFGLSLDANVNLKKAYARTRKVIIGNVNPVTVARASKSKISEEIINLVNMMYGIDKFILSTGCDLPPETPIDNILLFREIALRANTVR